MTSVTGLATAELADQLSDEPREISRECDVCNQVITGKTKGGGSLAWKMGLHKKNVHGVKGAGRKRASKKAPTAEDYDAHPVTSAVRDIASAVTGTGAPNADALAAAGARGLSMATFAFAAVLVESDQAVPPAGRQALIDYLTLPEEAGKALLRPVGKMVAPTSLNQRFGRTFVENIDVVGAVAELMQFGYHWREYLQLRRQTNALIAQQIAGAQANGMQPPNHLAAVPDLPMSAPAQQGANVQTHTPPPVNGVVVSADQVQAMIARQNQGVPTA